MYLRGLVPLNDRWERKVSRHTCWIPFAPLLSEFWSDCNVDKTGNCNDKVFIGYGHDNIGDSNS